MKDKKNTEEVYSATELSDLLSSPVFYSVLALTFFLGLSSVFGFLQNPRKLKTVVDVISEKVSSAKRVNTSFSLPTSEDKVIYADNNQYSIFAKELFAPKTDRTFKQGLQKVSFNYDITSKDFWGSLDSSRLESAEEESYRKDVNGFRLGTPLSPEYYVEEGDSKYSLKATDTDILSL